MDLDEASLCKGVAEESTNPSLKPANSQVGLKCVSIVSKMYLKMYPRRSLKMYLKKHPKVHLKIYLNKILPEDGLVGRGAKVKHAVVQAGVLVHLEREQFWNEIQEE